MSDLFVKEIVGLLMTRFICTSIITVCLGMITDRTIQILHGDAWKCIAQSDIDGQVNIKST